MKRIPLTKGKFAKVDDEDYNWLMQWNWHANSNGNDLYAKRAIVKNGIRGVELMHRVIMGLNHKSKRVIDHIDHDGLNNQRANLRICTRKQNLRNRRPSKNGTSKYLGVSKSASRKNVWDACIQHNKKKIRIGYFNSEKEAAIAYNKMAKKYHRKYANLNRVK